ncbi:MAG TPA: alpha/beta hydrolase, partial [Phycisphaerae bacterium]|nr:alpha/beta hydrolase [Phycisphaerae bacterium]
MAARVLTTFVVVLAGVCACAGEAPLADAGPPFGRLPLLDEVDCSGGADASHAFTEDPKGISRVETILGRPCRTLPPEGGAKYIAYRLGKGKGLKAGAAYLLTVEFPEDRPRALFIVNRGCETGRGFSTGAALGDVLYTYTENNPESVRLPLSGAYRTWTMLFHLHDRYPDMDQPRGAGPRPMTPEEGFQVIIAQSTRKNAPLSAGAAVSRIRLFEVPDPARFNVPLRLPPEGLPRRHLFFREEMADGVLDPGKDSKPGIDNETDWFESKARLMQFLGMNTFGKDLLEFGHNQGWDATEGGGNDWYWANRQPKRWQRILEMLSRYDFDVLPYYEYCGSVGAKGVGKQRKCVTLSGGKTYTHITWSEKANADVTDPETLADAKKLLDATILRHKDKVNFVGAWFRTRPSHIPMSFSDRCLGLFAKEANSGVSVSREQLKGDDALRQKYYAWWFEKRKAFLAALRDHLRSGGVPEAVVLFTAVPSEPCPCLRARGKFVVTDDPETWKALLVPPDHQWINPLPVADVIAAGEYLKAALRPTPTWAQWEWQHSIPQPDPARYADTPGILMTYPFNRTYTVSSPEAFDAFHTASGLAIVRHYPLNEHVMEKKVGYFVCDVERAGPYCMLGEARAMAYGDPRYIGYLAGASFNRGFPEYVRAFNAAFLALPALPSHVVKDAAADPEVVVRSIPTKGNGTYLAVVNVGLGEKRDIAVALPAQGKITDAATGRPLTVTDGRVQMSLGPCSLRAIHIQPETAATPFPGEKATWHGYDRYTFTHDRRKCYVVVPKQTAPGHPWIWRARFWAHEPQTDLALLAKGFHLVYMDVANLFGSPQAVAHWNAFYEYLISKHGLAKKAALEGMSRGGLIIFNWAAANPDKVACIYADAPVCDFKSWPAGKGKGKGTSSAWRACKEAYGFAS